ncbi:MAG: SDR family NAD(P)-dependent oxidoreductase, partial [Bdellovibrionales bacterium]|nr:SDR family NAD(P)-dependent oxidoreductase [Bdellovibrionales bacterium]
MQQMKDWNTVVTGAGKGIGLELTRQLLAMGTKVVATVRGQATPELEKLRSDALGRLQIHSLDVLKEGAAEALAKSIEPLGPLDLLINNAGVIGDKTSGLEHVTTDVVLNTFDTNSVGPLRVTRALLPLLLKSAHPRVVQISSLMGSISDNSGGGYYAYRMSKAALNMFNKSLS